MVKKILFLSIILAIFYSFNIIGYASTWNYIWTNQIVEIPVGDELNKYIDMPRANLYRNGVLLEDANITYLKEGDWLYYLKDVDTSKVGEYKVWYKAFENEKYKPGTCTDYKCLITFKVVDKIAPKILINNEKLIVKKGMDVDFLNNVFVSDNYDSEVYVYFDKNIEQIIGAEEILVTAIDSSGNKTTASFVVEVTNVSKPIITFNNINNEINIPLNGNIDITEFFSAYDSYDGDITSNIIFPSLKITGLGTYNYTVYVKNSSNLETSYTITINIIDDVCPEIVLLDDIQYFEYDQDFSLIDFSNFITISDNIAINYSNLEISHDIENKVGNYIVTYRYSDDTFVVEKKLRVVLTSSKAPVINVTDIEITLGDELNLMDFIEVYDESDPNVLDNVEIYHSIDTNTPGEYNVTVYAVNSSGISITKDFIVRVLAKEDNSLKEDIAASKENIIEVSNDNSNNDNETFDKILSYLTQKDKEQQERNDKIFIILVIAVVGIVIIQIVSHKKKKNI